MALLDCNCNYRCRCTLAALIVSAVIGVLSAFFLITGIITVAPVFLWVVLGIGVVYLGVLLVATALARNSEGIGCQCRALNMLLIGILGAIAFAVVLLAVGIVATSPLSAILVGLLLFFFSLALTASACLIRYLANCES